MYPQLSPGQIRHTLGALLFFGAGIAWFACGYLTVVGVGAMVLSAAFLLSAIWPDSEAGLRVPRGGG